jgi:hypothetical protein
MSKLIYISKSDFKIAKSCATKLYYKKLGYPQNQEVDYSFSISALIINKIAELLYDHGIEIKTNSQDEDSLTLGIEQTNKELEKEIITLFKPLIYHQHKLARLDILVKQGNKFDLIYVKPKAIDLKSKNTLRNKRDNKINSIWKGYLQDITYQTYILSQLLESLEIDYEINAYLCLPIRNKISKSCLGSNFSIDSSYKVEFLGDLNELKNDHILQFIDVNQEILELKEKVVTNTQIYLDSIVNGIKKIQIPISKNCKNCEFRINELQLSGDRRNGFNECWSQVNDRATDQISYQNAHILDLYQVAKIGEYHNPLINTLIAEGKSSLYDIPVHSLNHDGFKHRQLIQINYTRNNQEWISENLAEVTKSLEYPLHFIDFETCRLDIAYDQKITANEQLAFQWSCHTITEPFSDCINTSFIDVSGDFPNFRFAESLMQQLGDRGTVFVWGTHEKSVLKDIYDHVLYYQYQNQDLLMWLQGLIAEPREHQNLRLVDMNNLTLKYYFHPLMKGKTSLKSVLPAIWTTNNYLHQISWLSQYLQTDQSGKILSPYQTLPEIEIDDRNQVIKEGSGAMIAYQLILYSPIKHDPVIRAKWEQLLKQYCCLDTLAMVIVWTHWHYLLAQVHSHRKSKVIQDLNVE